MSYVVEKPLSGFCEGCHNRCQAVPGPARTRVRAEQVRPIGHRLAYVVELAHRSFLVCRECIEDATRAVA